MRINRIQESLGEFVNFANGKTSPPRDDSFPINVYGSNGVIGRSAVSNSKGESVIIGRVGSYCGSVHYSSNDCWVSDNAINATPFIEKESKFWYFFLYYTNLNQFREGSGQPLLNQAILKNLIIDVPSDSKERILIGESLFYFNQKIDLNTQTSQTLQSLAQSLFKAWFVDFLPVRAKAKALASGTDPEQAAMQALSGKSPEELAQLPEAARQALAQTAALFPVQLTPTEQGEIPEGWEWSTLSYWCDLNPEAWSKRNTPDSIVYIDLGNVNRGRVLQEQPFSWESAPSRARRILREGDTIVGTVRPGNRSFFLVPQTEYILTGSTGFAVLRPKHEWAQEFVYLTATLDSNIARLVRIADGGAYPAVNPQMVFDSPAVAVPDELLKSFSTIVRPLFALCAQNEKANKKLTDIRDTLLPKLLSGEIELNTQNTPVESL